MPDKPSIPHNAADPFDLNALRIQAPGDPVARQVMTTLAVRKPSSRNAEFFRVHPDPDYAFETCTLEWGDGLDKVTYLVSGAMQFELREHVRRARLYTCVNRNAIPFLWAAKLPGDTGPGRIWAQSALDAAEAAKEEWVRISGNRDRGAYDLFVALGPLGEPVWPDKTFDELIRLGFKDHVINSADHLVVKEINGLV